MKMDSGRVLHFLPDKIMPRAAEKTNEKEKSEFVIRNSTLTNLLEVYHFRSVFTISLAVFVLMYLNIIIYYFFYSQKFKKDVSIFLWTFGKLHIVTATWLGMMFSIVFIFYPVFRFWCNTRFLIWKRRFYDSIFCFFFVIYQMAFLIIPAKIVLNCNIPPASTFIVICEQLRLMMKTHAFMRENAARLLTFKPHQDNDKTDFRHCPEVQKFIYFLFAPTLLYKDDYPRTPYVRWRYVAWNFLQVWGCIMAAYIPVTYFLVDKFNKAGTEPIPLADFMSLLAMSILGGCVIMLTIFYGLLHCWLNAFAEMLRFGDRKFYDDWWNCTSFAKFYRSWNLVVYKWLYFYVYQDVYTILGKNKIGAMYMVFFISAVAHEYLLAMVSKYVFPLLFFLYMTVGTMYVFLTRRATSIFWNAFLWGSLLQGWGFLIVFYCLEWYARINCPRTLDSWVDHLMPRSFTCNIVSLQV